MQENREVSKKFGTNCDYMGHRKPESQRITSVAPEELHTTSLGDTDGLELELGVKHFSPRRTYETVQELEERESDLYPSDVETIRVESPELGRVSTGSGDLFKRATELQKQKRYEGGEVTRGLKPDYIIVSAPRKTLRGEEATIEDTLTQLEAAQDTIRDVDEPVDFGGRILIENRSDSVLSTPEDLGTFEEKSGDYQPWYSIDLSTRHGVQMLLDAPEDRVGNMRFSGSNDDRYGEVFDGDVLEDTYLTEGSGRDF